MIVNNLHVLNTILVLNINDFQFNLSFSNLNL